MKKQKEKSWGPGQINQNESWALQLPGDEKLKDLRQGNSEARLERA